jgi:hypothetical protein
VHSVQNLQYVHYIQVILYPDIGGATLRQMWVVAKNLLHTENFELIDKWPPHTSCFYF